MIQYKYVGDNQFLVGHTALGRTVDGVFKVQVDNILHLWSHGWHEQPQEDWIVEYDGEIEC